MQETPITSAPASVTPEDGLGATQERAVEQAHLVAGLAPPAAAR